jgi:hypothetical protein
LDYPPIALPPRISDALRERLAIPVAERLLTRKPASKEPLVVRTISEDNWADFLGRQNAHQAKKKRIDLDAQKKVVTTRDGPVYERLFEESRRDPYEDNLPESQRKPVGKRRTPRE